MSETQTPQKRTREETSAGDGSKRRKPFDIMLNLLDEEEPEPCHESSRDLSAIFTTLQNEISPTAYPPPAAEDADEDECLKLSLILRHLFEASDDELGIPNRSPTDEIHSETAFNSELAFNGDGLWELEDEAANYCTVLQSELFM